MRHKLFAALSLAFPLIAGHVLAMPPPVATNPAAAALLDRARLWESRNRLELARETLAKLFRVAPEHPDGLATLALIEARAAKVGAARAALERLRRVAPGHPGIAQVDILLRLSGADKDKLRQARQLAQQSRLATHRDQLPKALAAYQELFPEGVPDGDLALEYWQLVAEDSRSWDAAHRGLLQLARRHPDNLRYRLALAEHETVRPPLNRRALQVLVDMTRLPEFQGPARAAWRRALLRLEPAAEHRALLEEYLEREPNDSIVQERLKVYAEAEESRRRLMADPGYRARVEGLALLEHGNPEEAEQRFESGLRAKPDDGELAGNLGLIRLRQGHHAQAQALFEQARRNLPEQAAKWQGLADTARFWGLLREAGDARGAGEFILAEDLLREALRLNAREPAAQLALARVLGDRRRYDEADAAYRQVSAAEPGNRAALGERLQLLVKAGRGAEARQGLVALDAAQRKALGKDVDIIEAGLLGAEAEAFLAAGRQQEALLALEQAVRLDGDDPWLRFALARRYAARQEPERGLKLFDEYLARRPKDAGGLYALALLQSSADKELDALWTLERIEPGDRDAKITRMQRELWVRLQLQRARERGQAGHREQARALLNETERATAGDAELVTLVALAWANVGDAQYARRLLEGLRGAARALSIAWHLDYAEVLEQADDDAEMERVLSGLPGAPTPEHAERMLLLRETATLRRAEIERADGRFDAARQRLEAALARQGERPALLLALARVEQSAARPEVAESLFSRVLELNPDDPDARVELARLMFAAGKFDTLIAAVDRWLASGIDGTEPALPAAGLRLSGALGGVTSPAQLALLRARALRAAGQPDTAELALRRLLSSDPSFFGAREELARQLLATGRADAALALIESGLEIAADEDLDAHLGSLAVLLDLRAHAVAWPVANGILARAPDDARGLVLAGQLALADGRPDAAIAYLQRGLAREQEDAVAQRRRPPLSSLRVTPTSAVLERTAVAATARRPDQGGDYRRVQLASLLDERASWLSMGHDARDRKGTSGISQYFSREVPVEIMRPLPDGGRWFMRSDLTEVRAGRVDMISSDAATFGGVALCQPNCAEPRNQAASGASLALGYQRQDFRFDIGTSPIGFPVTNFVGGVADKRELGPFTLSLEASRRPLPGSVLSWAGTRDPYSDRVWGGVVATGVRMGLSRDEGGAFGFWSSLGLHQLTGKNVQSNNRRQLMAGGYWRVINDDNQLFSIGLTGMDWRFARNVGEYTFGHGGYYSPSHYQSLSVPMTYAQRFDRFSYVLRAARSRSRAQTDGAPYYPTDGQMQADAVAKGIDPNHTASTGNGRSQGRSFQLGWEYQWAANVFIGGRVELERSQDYTPNRKLFYLRFNLDRPAAQAVKLSPDPIIPYSQF